MSEKCNFAEVYRELITPLQTQVDLMFEFFNRLERDPENQITELLVFQESFHALFDIYITQKFRTK